MTARLEVTKTYKLFIGGQFPRSESGRSIEVRGPGHAAVAHVSRASRKDLRDAVEAARAGQGKWAAATAYNRAQVLYRMAEMLEGKRDEFVQALTATRSRRASSVKRSKKAGQSPDAQVAASIDRLVSFAGWADKFAHVLGCQNPVSGPFYNFTTPEATGVVGVIAPDEPALLALVSLMAPVLCSGNAVVALGSATDPIVPAILGEVCATSDVPPGVVNILTGRREELVPHFASHRELDAIHAAGLEEEHATTLRKGVAENLKRVRIQEGRIDWYDRDACHGPWWIEPFVEMKTVWHPSAT